MVGHQPVEATAAMEAIRAHLAAHPDAADDARGIVGWWLSGDPATAGSLAQIEHALERLEAAGEIERVGLPDGRVLYRGRRH